MRGQSFRAVEPQAPVTDEEMRFGLWLAAARDDIAASLSDAEFYHWRDFYWTRIWGPTVEWVPLDTPDPA